MIVYYCGFVLSGLCLVMFLCCCFIVLFVGMIFVGYFACCDCVDCDGILF